MRAFPDVRMRKLLDDFVGAREALREGEYEKARQGFVGALAAASRHGLDSASARAALAMIHESMEEYELALESLMASLELDPLDGLALRVNERLIHAMRERFAGIEPGAAEASRLYALLQRCDGATVDTHLMMARHHRAAGRLDEAERLLEALCALAPASADVWRAQADLALARGDVEQAATCRAEARCRENADVAFAFKGAAGEG